MSDAVSPMPARVHLQNSLNLSLLLLLLQTLHLRVLLPRRLWRR
jgi:hypothetical protein